MVVLGCRKCKNRFFFTSQYLRSMRKIRKRVLNELQCMKPEFIHEGSEMFHVKHFVKHPVNLSACRRVSPGVESERKTKWEIRFSAGKDPLIRVDQE